MTLQILNVVKMLSDIRFSYHHYIMKRLSFLFLFALQMLPGSCQHEITWKILIGEHFNTFFEWMPKCQLHNGHQLHNGNQLHNGHQLHNGYQLHNDYQLHNGYQLHNQSIKVFSAFK